MFFMKTLIFAHPQNLSLSSERSDYFWTQNPQDVVNWKRENTSGIIVLDLDACERELWNVHPSYVYIGFSDNFELLQQAKKEGFHFIVSKGKDFSNSIHIAIQNAKENLILQQENNRLRELLCQNQSDQEMSLLLGGISHDFNNILSIVLGSAKVLKNTSELTASQNELLSSIIDATTHGKELSKQLMQYQNKSLESCDINTVLYRIGSLIQKSLPSNISLSISKSPQTKVNISAADLIRVLMNLILNARDAMPDGGEIQIHVRELPSFVQLLVQDNGQGMTPEVLSRIFEPFYTTKKKLGTGLGLAGVQNIIQKKKGQILCSSQKGEGTIFTIELPYWHPPDVFILDHDKERAKSVQNLIKSKGKTVVLCQNIADLIQKIQHAPLGTIVVSSSYSNSFPFEMFLRQYLILCGKAKEDDLWNVVLPPKSTAQTISQSIPV